jgi:choline-glycine betaine transporter
MSDDGPEWFAPKPYGYGSGPPISWQGWAVTIGFVALTVLLSLSLRERPLQLIAAIVPLTIVLMVICAKTTRGGWRWRWGDRD